MKNETPEARIEIVTRATELLANLSPFSFAHTNLISKVREWMDGKRETGDIADLLDNEERKAA